MARECAFTGKKTKSGRTYHYRGRAKYLGGVGQKVTGKAKRKFKPNVQKVTVLKDGKPQKLPVSAKAMRQGLVSKPLKRRYARRQQQQ